SATGRLHGRKRACIRTRAGSAEYDVGGDHAKGRWPKRPPLHTMGFEGSTTASARRRRIAYHATFSTPRMNASRFCLILVKPSHYDDDGYVIQWFRSTIPSNSLAAVYGLARDCQQRHALGPDVEIEIHPFDETNTRIRPEKLARMIEKAGAGMVMLIGVQSNQFPHALDLAKPLLERGIKVGIGGFHVSGITSMLNGECADVKKAKAMGITMFCGEGEEGRV